MRKKYCMVLAVISACVFLGGCRPEGTDYLLSGSSAAKVESVPAVSLSGVSSDSAGSGVGETGASASSETAAEAEEKIAGNSGQTLCVYVCGEVVRPGVYLLPENSRVYQALEAAGGMTDAADPKALNQAELLTDGQQITVYSVEEAERMGISGIKTAVSGAGASGGQSGISAKVNINTAGKEELMTLSGIGESRAEDIIRYREEHGGFSSVEDIQNVGGIGEKSFQKIREQIEV